MTTGDHYRVDLPGHANPAAVVLDLTGLLHRLVNLTHHLGWVDHPVVRSGVDRRENRCCWLRLIAHVHIVRHVIVALGLQLLMGIRRLDEVRLQRV